jgi:hypothetical protein
MNKLIVRHESPPERCEICHQSDRFNPETSFCSRCQGALKIESAPHEVGPSPLSSPEELTRWFQKWNRKFRIVRWKISEFIQKPFPKEKRGLLVAGYVSYLGVLVLLSIRFTQHWWTFPYFFGLALPFVVFVILSKFAEIIRPPGNPE